MKRKNIFTFMLLVSFAIISNANVNDRTEENNKVRENTIVGKSWEFYSTIKSPTKEDLDDGSSSKFGEEAGYLYDMFLFYYVAKEDVVAGDPAKRIIIRKPAIYNAVRAVEKQLHKKMKDSAITKELATDRYIHVLKSAISAIDSDSQSFENILYENRKKPEVLLTVFECVSLIEL